MIALRLVVQGYRGEEEFTDSFEDRRREKLGEDVGKLGLGWHLGEGNGTVSYLVPQPPHTHSKMSIACSDDWVGCHLDTCCVVLVKCNGGYWRASHFGDEVSQSEGRFCCVNCNVVLCLRGGETDHGSNLRDPEDGVA